MPNKSFNQQILVDKFKDLYKHEDFKTLNKDLLKFIKSKEFNKINIQDPSFEELLKLIFTKENRNFTMKDIQKVFELTDFSIYVVRINDIEKAMPEDEQVILKNMAWCKAQFITKKTADEERMDANWNKILYNNFKYNKDDMTKETEWCVNEIIHKEDANKLGLTKYYCKEECLNLLYNEQAESWETYKKFGKNIYLFTIKDEFERYKKAVIIIADEGIDIVELIKKIKFYIESGYITFP